MNRNLYKRDIFVVEDTQEKYVVLETPTKNNKVWVCKFLYNGKLGKAKPKKINRSFKITGKYIGELPGAFYSNEW